MIKITDFKTRKGLITFLLLVLLISLEANAQNEVAIGSATTKSNAILWLNGNGSQGLILPIVSNKTAVSNPDKGMIVYDNSDNKVWYRNDNAWAEVGGGGASAANLSLALSANQLQLKDGTTTLSTVNIAGGTQSNGAFMVFSGGSWQYATLSGDVTGANGSLQVDGIKGKTIPALPASTQALVYDGTAWKFQALTGSSGTLTSITAGTGLTGGTITTIGTINVDVGTTANKVVQLDASGKLPAVDGSQLTNLAGDISAVTAGTGLTGGATTGAATLSVDVGTTANKIVQLDGAGKLPAVDGSQLTNLAGDISAVTAGTGLTGGATSGAATLNVDVGTTANKIVQLDATGKLPALDGSQLTNLAGGGDITGVTAGVGLIGGGLSGSVTLNVDAGTTANKIVQLDGSGKLPAIDGSQLTNLTGDISAVTAGTGLTGGATTGAATLNVDVGTTANKIVQLDATGKLPAVDGSQLTNLSGDISAVTAGTGLTGGATTGAATLNVDVGTTANKIVQLDATGKLPAVDGSSLTNLNATNITSGALPLNRITTGSGGTVLTMVSGVPTWSSPSFTNPMTTAGDIIYGGVSGAATRLAGTTGILKSNGTTPSWGSVNLAGADVTGILPVTNGGTGKTTWSGLVFGSGSTLADISTGTDGQVLKALAGTPTWQNLNIANADVSTTAAIDGTKILPNFGDQNISTTGASTIAGGLAVGSTNQFGVDATGNIIKINNVSTSFPSIQGDVNSVLTNDGSGNLSWAAAAAGWNLTGNTNTDPTSNFIGTTDTRDLVFKTNSTEYARLGSGGSFAIGTNAPVAGSTLDVFNGTTGSVYIRNSTSALRMLSFGTETFIQSGASTTAGSSANLVFSDMNANKRWMTITGSGNIGIGTSTPNAPLEFASIAGNRKIVFWDTQNNDHQFIGFGLSPNVLRYQTDNSLTDHVFYTGASSTTSNELMRISGKGNVGIGTSTPNAPLQFPNTVGRKIVLFEQANNDHEYIGFGVGGFGTLNYQLPVNSNDHVFLAATSATTSNELMRIKGIGDVGIGTSTPAAKLDIAGTIKITDGTQGAGKVLTSDANGLASWQTAASGSGWLLTGNALSGGEKLGSTNGNPLPFITNGAERMRIDGAGNVGIGTAAPTTTLHVQGPGNFDVANSEGDFKVGNGTYRFKVGVAYAGGGAGDVYMGAQGGTSRLFIGGGTTTADFQTITVGGGNVGIGTTSPAAKLEVAGQIKITGGSPASNRVLTSDAAGLATWTDIGTFTGTGTITGTNTYFGLGLNGRTTTGVDNTAIGYNALGSNTTAGGNTALGRGALYTQTVGAGSTTVNTAVGYQSSYQNTTGKWNTSMGYNSGYNNITGSYNTFIGSLAGETGTGSALNYASAIGHNAQVTASNTMVFGSSVADGSATVGWGFGVQPGAAAIRVGNSTSNGNGATLTLAGTWTNASDSTKKYNIRSISYGLSEIMKLKPVNYRWKGTGQQDFGFLAQEVKTVLPEIVYGEEGQMTVSYGQLTAVLTKAMQEQQQEIEELKAKLKEKDDKVNSLEGSVSSMRNELDAIKRVLGMQTSEKASSKK